MNGGDVVSHEDEIRHTTVPRCCATVSKYCEIRAGAGDKWWVGWQGFRGVAGLVRRRPNLTAMPTESICRHYTRQNRNRRANRMVMVSGPHYASVPDCTTISHFREFLHLKKSAGTGHENLE